MATLSSFPTPSAVHLTEAQSSGCSWCLQVRQNACLVGLQLWCLLDGPQNPCAFLAVAFSCLFVQGEACWALHTLASCMCWRRQGYVAAAVHSTACMHLSPH